MDFFDRQEKSQARSRFYLFAFVVAAIGALFVLYWVVTGCLIVAIGTFNAAASYFDVTYAENFAQYLPATLYGSPPDVLSFRPIFVVTSFTALFLVLLSSLKILRLRIGGGAYVAKSLGGQPLTRPSTFQERQLVHVVEEMAVASGLPRPRIYILPREKNINAVTAGRDQEDAVIVVTQGALDLLDRDELQGVVAHEFAHILNDDSALNLSMCGWLYGLLFFYGLGHKFCDASSALLLASLNSDLPFKRERSSGALVAIPVLLAGLILLIGGWLGKIAVEIFQAAFSREREYLADAFAVGFTRNPFGLAGALKKIARMPQQGHLASGQSLAMKSFFIVSPARIPGLLRSHPPLKKRILALDPDWDGRSVGPAVKLAVSPKAATAAVNSAVDKLREAGLAARSPLGLVWAPGRPGLASDRAAQPPDGLASARRLLESLPEEIKQAVDDPDRAGPLTAALFLHDDPDLAAVQRDIIQRIMGPEAAWQARDFKFNISEELRLPLLTLAAPVLKELPGADRLRLFQAARELAGADGRTDFFEVAAFQILRKHLELPSAPERAAPGPEAVEKAAVILMSIMAHVGSADSLAAGRAFTFASGQFARKPFQLAPRSTANSEDLARALDLLSLAPEEDRRWLVSALKAAAVSDQVVTPAEYELLRAVAAALDMPLPLLN